jgi:hypothetical protein
METIAFPWGAGSCLPAKIRAVLLVRLIVRRARNFLLRFLFWRYFGAFLA